MAVKNIRKFLVVKQAHHLVPHAASTFIMASLVVSRIQSV